MYEVLNNMRKKKVEERKKLIGHYEALTKEPMAAQEKLLMELMSANKDTEYGKKYGFADISSIEEYQSRVPITEYEDYTEYIDRMVSNGEDNMIYAEKPVWYNKTSGTVGKSKIIPYSQRMRDWFARYSLGYQSGLLYRELGEDYFGGRSMNLIRCGGDIADPWYTHDFETTYKDIYEGCEGLAEVLYGKKNG